MADATDTSPDLASLLRTHQADEHLFDPLAKHLLAGVATDKGWLRLVKNNVKVTADDRNEYETDFRLELDGALIGYLDIEVKPRWAFGGWPWPKINIARHPKSQWDDDRFDGRPTNKLISFQQLPELSFWVALRNDYRAALVVRAEHIFNSSIKSDQQTRYSDLPLPIYELRTTYGQIVNDADALRNLIVGEVLRHADH